MTINSGVVKADDLDRKDNSSEDKSNYKKVGVGDIAYNSMRMWQGASGYSLYSGILSPAYTVITPRENINSRFFSYDFKRHSMIQLFKRYSQGLTSDTWNLKYPALKSIKVSVPVLEEQDRISDFFSALDHLITLQQCEHHFLHSDSKSSFSESISHHIEVFTAIIFHSSTNTWEQRKLGEIAEIVRGASPRPIKDPKWFDTESDIGWLRISDVTEQNGRIYYLEQRISKLGQKKTRVLLTPHLLLSIAATVGKPLINYVKTGVHDGFLVFMKPKFDLEYMFQWLDAFRLNWQRYGQPGSQVNLNSDLVKNQELLLPSISEQQSIGSFFSTLDHLITLQQCKPLVFISSVLKAIS